MTTEQRAQVIFEQRGYLVIASLDEVPIGEVLDCIDWGLDHAVQEVKDHKLVVIAETTEDDHEQQAKLAGVSRWKNTKHQCRYYRVVAE